MLFNDAEELHEQCSRKLPDLLLVDNQLPRESGFSVAARYSKALPSIRIIMMSVLDQKQHFTQGYEAGAMLYLPKRFEPEALRACLRGVFDNSRQAYRLTLKMEPCRLHHAGGSIALSGLEAKLLRCLSLRSPKVVEYFELMDVVGFNMEQSKKTSLEVFVSRLRKKLQPIEGHSLAIKNKQNLGYVITEPLQVIFDC